MSSHLKLTQMASKTPLRAKTNICKHSTDQKDPTSDFFANFRLPNFRNHIEFDEIDLFSMHDP